jgi:hypothetical protein
MHSKSTYIGLKITLVSWSPGVLNKEHTRTKNNPKRQKGELPLLPTHTTH